MSLPLVGQVKGISMAMKCGGVDTQDAYRLRNDNSSITDGFAPKGTG